MAIYTYCKGYPLFMRRKSGHTLVELIIYTALISAIGLSFVYFIISVSQTRTKAFAVSEVQANARFAVDVIARRIRSANGVNGASSVFGSDPGVLSLAMDDVSKNPTVFDLDQDDGRLRMTEGASAPVFLSSGLVEITRLMFTDQTAPSGAHPNIMVEMTITYRNVDGGPEFDYAEDVRTGATIRK